MKADILLSGAGGQGLMSLGKILAKAALEEGKYATYIPSYGAEVRGGTAYCFVKISDTPIASPIVEEPDAAIILNQSSLEKFEKIFKKKSLLILNSDLCPKKPLRKDIEIIYLPLNKMALASGNARVIGVLSLGIFLGKRPGLLKSKTVIEVLKNIFSKEVLEQNIKALQKGEKIL